MVISSFSVLGIDNSVGIVNVFGIVNVLKKPPSLKPLKFDKHDYFCNYI